MNAYEAYEIVLFIWLTLLTIGVFFILLMLDRTNKPNDTVQPKTGHWWERNTYPQERRCWGCSECQETVFEKTNYCPNCGAHME